jgi:hypothetical protein
LRAVAHALQQDCAGEIGPGTVARVCRELQRQFFDRPTSIAGMPRWSSRRRNGVRAV